MNDLVIDSSVVLKWYRSDGEDHVPLAKALRDAFTAGRVRFSAPPLLAFEMLNVAGRKWGWSEQRLIGLMDAVAGLQFNVVSPALTDVARWTATGLSAYDAAYVAVAEATGSELVTADGGIVAAAPELARALADAGELV